MIPRLPVRLRTMPVAVRRRLLPGPPGPAILLYHRVAERPVDPWGMCVAPDRFAAHLAHLRSTREPLPLAEMLARLEAGTLPSLAVSVTFDDGYLDNARTAAPLLVDAGIPATFFLTTGAIGSNQPFWWDELVLLTLAHPGPIDHTVTVGGRPVALRWPAAPTGPDGVGWRAWEPPRTPRQRAYHELWTALHGLAPDERQATRDELRAVLGPTAPGPDPADMPMTGDDVAALAARPDLTVGAHSCSHPTLSDLPVDTQRAEIASSRRSVEALTGAPAAGFAYPHGSRSPATRQLVADAGFSWACSTQRTSIDPGRADRLDLPRLTVGDWTADELDRALGARSLPRP